MPLTDVEAGLGGFLGGVSRGYADVLRRKQAAQQQEIERQRALAERQTERQTVVGEKKKQEEQDRTNWNQIVTADMSVLSGLLNPQSKVPSDQARTKLSTLEQQHGTKLTPIFDIVTKQRQSQPYLGTDEQGQRIPNPTYVPKYTNKVDNFPDVKRNLMISKTADYDPLTGNYRKDAEGNVIYKEEKTLGKLFETNKSKTAGSGRNKLSPGQQQNLNKLAAEYIKTQAAVTAINTLPPPPDDYMGTNKQKAVRTAILTGETARVNLESWIDQVMPAADHAETFMSGLKKAAKGKNPDQEYFWKKVTDNYKGGKLDDLDVQLLAYKYLTMYGTFPKGYIPAFQASGAMTTPNQDQELTGDEEQSSDESE